MPRGQLEKCRIGKTDSGGHLRTIQKCMVRAKVRETLFVGLTRLSSLAHDPIQEASGLFLLSPLKYPGVVGWAGQSGATESALLSRGC